MRNILLFCTLIATIFLVACENSVSSIDKIQIELSKGNVQPAIKLFIERAEGLEADFKKMESNHAQRKNILKQFPVLDPKALDLMSCILLDYAAKAYDHANTLAQVGGYLEEADSYQNKAYEVRIRSDTLCPFENRVKTASRAIQALN